MKAHHWQWDECKSPGLLSNEDVASSLEGACIMVAGWDPG